MNPIKRLFTLIVSPNKSWGTITEDKNYTQESLSSSLLYPILGLFAIIVFFKEIEFTSERYNSGIEKAIQYAVIAFIQIFSTYYISTYLLKRFFKQYDKEKINVYLIYLTSIVALFYIMMTMLSNYVIYIAPLSLYIIYEAWIGYRYINSGAVNTDSKFVISVSTMILMLPLVISFVLRTLLTLI